MRRHLITLALMLGLLSPAKAADSTVPAMTAAGAFTGVELMYIVQGGADRKGTPAQMATYTYSLASGDCTISSGGAVVCTKTNGVAFGALATLTPGTGVATALGVNVGTAGAFVVNGGALGTPSSGTLTNASGLPIAGLTGLGTGVGTWLGTPSSANLAAAITDETGSGVVVFGTAPTISSPTINTAATFGFITGSTQCLHVNTSGVLSGTGSDCGAGGGTGANPTATAGPAAVNGVATTFLRSDGAPAIQLGTSGQKGIVQVDGTTITATAGVISAVGGGSGTVTSITPGAGIVSGVTASCTQTAITASGTVSQANCLNAQTGTSYAIVDGDRFKLVTGSNAAAQAYSIAQAGTASAFANGWCTTVLNKGVGTLTITPTTSTINGAAIYALFAGQSVKFCSDGSNYQIDPGSNGGVTVSDQTGSNYPFVASDFGKLIYLSNASNQIPSIASASSLGANWFVQACNTGAGTQTITPASGNIGGAATFVLPAGSVAAPQCAAIISDGTNFRVYPDFFRFGANVATAAGTTLSAAGGLTTTLVSGTSAMGTGAIGSAACASAVTTSATGTAITDTIQWGFNSDPTAVTGYVPLTTGMLTIISYPSSGNVNFKVCNNTSSSITPGAITLNWRVLR